MDQFANPPCLIFALWYKQLWRALKEILNGLSAAINALHLVHPAYAWIDPLLERNANHNEQYPSKKARITIEDQPASNDVDPQSWKSYIDIQKIENEFVLTSAEYLLSLAHVKWTNTEFLGVTTLAGEQEDDGQ